MYRSVPALEPWLLITITRSPSFKSEWPVELKFVLDESVWKQLFSHNIVLLDFVR